VTTPRRAARAAKAKAEAPPRFDWRDPKYGIAKWPPGPDNPVTGAVLEEARRRARADREAWEREHGPPPPDDDA
jgi:hypothetical protein